MSEDLVRRASRRITAAQLVFGAVIGLVGNALHPHTADPDTATMLRSIEENAAWVGIHFAIITAMVFVVGGLIGFAQELHDGPGAPFARLGAGTVLLGGALVVVSTSIDGFAMKPLALAWTQASSTEAQVMLQVATGVKAVDFAIWSLGMLIMFGITFVCFGAALSIDGRYSPVLAWAAVIAGTGSVVAALLQIINTGEVQLAESIFLASSMLITLWVFVVGVLIWRATDDRRLLTARVGAEVR